MTLETIDLIDPSVSHGVAEPVRIAIKDLRTGEFPVLRELPSGGTMRLSSLHPRLHCDHVWKVQVRRDGRWKDLGHYNPIVQEGCTEDGIKYLYFPDHSSRHLSVIFQAINVEPGYNYVKTLVGLGTNRLYIKDDYGSDAGTRSSYYLGPDRTLQIAECVQSLIERKMLAAGADLDSCALAGSSKGGFAALFHGYRMGVGVVVAGGPQVMLGDFLNSKSESSLHPPILRYLAGGNGPADVEWANSILFDAIRKSSRAPRRIFIHVGEREPHYAKHVVPLLEFLKAKKLPLPEVDLGDYASHSELAAHFPGFLRRHLGAHSALGPTVAGS